MFESNCYYVARIIIIIMWTPTGQQDSHRVKRSLGTIGISSINDYFYMLERATTIRERVQLEGGYYYLSSVHMRAQ